MNLQHWYEIKNTKAVVTPSLLVYPGRIQRNIENMIAVAGGTENLRPHIKTHKMGEIVKMQMKAGITKFKCATIAEAELLALCHAPDILLAMQPVGANIERFLQLMETYPNSKFSTLIDSVTVLRALGEMAASRAQKIRLWLDINNGMNRTGITPGSEALSLYESVVAHPNLMAEGLHVYDGHIRISKFDKRKRQCDEAFESVLKLKEAIIKKGLPAPKIVAGGSPTFPIHSARKDVEVSPGTTLLWDAGYGNLFPDMKFLPAAVLCTRIVSMPEKDLLCLDLGHKSIAPEMAFPRVHIFGMEDYEQIGQSEEHFVIRNPKKEQHEVGDFYYAIPVHICPTVAKYESVFVVSEGEITDTWKVDARNQKITI